MTRGAMKESLFRCFGYRRTTLDVVAYILCLVASSACMVCTDFPTMSWPFRIVCICIVWHLVFDYNAFLGVNGPTFYGVFASFLLPVDGGGCACAQFHICCLWIGSGLAKVGPWFSNNQGTFIWLPELTSVMNTIKNIL